MIHLDESTYSVVVLCDLCPPFCRLASSKAEGWSLGSDHERRAHPHLHSARDAAQVRARRARSR